VLDNVGLPYSRPSISPTATSGTIGTSDAEILVQLKPERKPFHARVHQRSPQESPQRIPRRAVFSSSRADIVTQILNFGTPAPVDIQITGMISPPILCRRA